MQRIAFIPAPVFSGVETCQIVGFTAASSIAGTYSPSRQILAGREAELVAVGGLHYMLRARPPPKSSLEPEPVPSKAQSFPMKKSADQLHGT
jgi:hypothetical protein